jgi:hypothetical protein
MERSMGAKQEDILDEVFGGDKDGKKSVYGHISSDLHREVADIKLRENKSISELVEAGLRLLVSAYKKRGGE